jgi:hypothetical protein
VVSVIVHRPNLKTLAYEATIDDPGAYTGPWSAWIVEGYPTTQQLHLIERISRGL